MNLNQQNFESELGHYSLLSLTLPPPSPHVFQESQGLLPPPNVVLALDISGSMLSSMQALKSTAMATVDGLCDGSKLKIVTFDSYANIVLESTLINETNREKIKSIIRENVINNHGCTNIQDALILSMKEPSTILFATDGLANIGFSSSSSLLTVARSLPTYKNCLINTLGLQLDEHNGLNAEMLKSLAFDTNGTFRLARDTEGLSSFIGDTLGAYYLRRFNNISVHAKSANGLFGEIIMPPLTGYVLRVDRPTHAVIRWPPGAIGPFDIQIESHSIIYNKSFHFEKHFEINHANEDAINLIVGSLAASYLSSNQPIDPKFISIIKNLAQNYTSLIPIAIALDMPKSNEQEGASARFSQQVFNFASLGGGEITNQVAELRAMSHTCSLSQT
jgi:hypothetical protein